MHRRAWHRLAASLAIVILSVMLIQRTFRVSVPRSSSHWEGGERPRTTHGSRQLRSTSQNSLTLYHHDRNVVNDDKSHDVTDVYEGKEAPNVIPMSEKRSSWLKSSKEPKHEFHGVKRFEGVCTPTEDLYAKARTKGGRNLEMMSGKIHTSLTAFTYASALKDNGWQWYSVPISLLVHSLLSDVTRNREDAHYSCIEAQQSNGSITNYRWGEHPSGVRFDCTDAVYRNCINAREGMIISVYNQSPAYVMNRALQQSDEELQKFRQLHRDGALTDEDLAERESYIQAGMASIRDIAVPPLHRFSDVVSLQWLLAGGTAETPIKWWFRVGLDDAVTVSVLKKLCKREPLFNIHITETNDSKNEEYPPEWPGWRYDVRKGKPGRAAALLGTPGGNGIAWMLSQSRARLGSRFTVKRIQYFRIYDKYIPESLQPQVLAFRIAPVPTETDD